MRIPLTIGAVLLVSIDFWLLMKESLISFSGLISPPTATFMRYVSNGGHCASTHVMLTQ